MENLLFLGVPILRHFRVYPYSRFQKGKLGSWLTLILIYIYINSISVKSGQREDDNERLCAVELCSYLTRFLPSVRFKARPVSFAG